MGKSAPLNVKYCVSFLDKTLFLVLFVAQYQRFDIFSIKKHFLGWFQGSFSYICRTIKFNLLIIKYFSYDKSRIS